MPEAVDLIVIKGMLVSLIEKQDAMSDHLDKIEEKLTKISSTVIGDKEFGHKGLVEQVEVLNKYVENDKIRNAKVVGGIAVIGIFWTLLLKFLNFK
jgi:hypothetical protein